MRQLKGSASAALEVTGFQI